MHESILEQHVPLFTFFAKNPATRGGPKRAPTKATKISRTAKNKLLVGSKGTPASVNKTTGGSSSANKSRVMNGEGTGSQLSSPEKLNEEGSNGQVRIFLVPVNHCPAVRSIALADFLFPVFGENLYQSNFL